MKKVLISAFVGSENLGDEAIFESILKNIDFNNALVMVTTVSPKKTAKHEVTPIHARRPLQIVAAIKKADLVIMGGGGIIQDQSSILNLLYFAFQIAVAKLYRTPVILCFVGVGPLKYWLSRFLLARLAMAMQYAIVRDKKSAVLLSQVTRSRFPIYTLHDPVLNYPVTKSVKKSTDNVLVSLRQWYFSYSVLPASIARKLNHRGKKSQQYLALVQSYAVTFDSFLKSHPETRITFVSFYDSEDQEMTKDVMNSMKLVDRCDLPSNNLTVEKYIEAINESRILFGMRLHSVILAAVAGKAFVAIDYSPKVRSFAEKAGQSDAIVSVDKYESRAFLNCLNLVYEEAKPRSEVIKKMRDKMARENQRGFDMISQSIAKL